MPVRVSSGRCPSVTPPVIVNSENLQNVGDLALLLNCTQGVRSIWPDRPVLVRQWKTPTVDVLAQLADHDIGLLLAKDAAASARAARGAVALIGGGQMVRDNASLASLMALAALMETARLTGGATAVLGCGVDRLTRGPHRLLWGRIMRGAALVTVRDEASLEQARDLCGASGRAPLLTADIVFTPSHVAEQPTTAGGGPRTIIVAPCADASEARSIDPRHAAEAAIALANRLGTKHITLTSHDSRDEMDPRACETVAAVIRETASDIQLGFVASCRLSAYTRLYASAAAVLTNRLHAIIFALLADKPIVVFDDGTAKTLSAARRFHIPTSPSGALMPATVLAALTCEAATGSSVERRAAIAQASGDAQANFDHLKARISAVGRVNASDKR